MEYSVLYDVSTAWPDLWFPAAGLLFVAISSIVWRLRHVFPGMWKWPARTRPWLQTAQAGCMVVFSMLLTLLAGVTVVTDHLRSRWALEDGTARTVVGPVERFVPYPAAPHKSEAFSVGGVHFEYSDARIVGGYHRTSGSAGPIREGVPVRVQYRDTSAGPLILKLELGTPAVRKPPPAP